MTDLADEPVGGRLDVTWVHSWIDVDHLAHDIQNPERDHCVVCASVPRWASAPFLDVEALAETLGESAHVYVLPTGEPSWELTRLLSPGMDVYGGALRVYRPLSESADPRDHPLYFIHEPADAAAQLDEITAAVLGRDSRGFAYPCSGSERLGVVTALRPHGVDLILPGGYRAFAARTQITSIEGLELERLVRVSQTVRVTVLEQERKTVWPVTLLPHAPDMWSRLIEQYSAGMVVWGIVVRVLPLGGFVELLPGVDGLVHKSKISREWVDDPNDYLKPGEILGARIINIDYEARKVELSLLDLDEDTPVAEPASILPGGPPWIADEVETLPDGVLQTESAHAERQQQLVPTDQVVEASAQPRNATIDAAETSDLAEPESDGGEDATALEPPESLDYEPLRQAQDELLATVLDARDAQRQLGDLFQGVEQQVAQLKAEAAQVRHGLERDLAEARVRVLEFAESEVGEIVRDAAASLELARGEAEGLRRQLEAAEADRRELLRRLKDEQGKTRTVEARVDRQRAELASERKRGDRLEEILDAAGVDAVKRFVVEVHLAWSSSTTQDDRTRFPWREPTLGPGFLDSLEIVQGISRGKVVEVAAHVVSGRAPDVPGLELHQMREGDGPTSPQLVRDDGATAWRCSLQGQSPAARRLHYWELPGGGVELANIVYHDDYSIS